MRDYADGLIGSICFNWMIDEAQCRRNGTGYAGSVSIPAVANAWNPPALYTDA
jgi:hypothetical protein